jgi:hypothetical protein
VVRIIAPEWQAWLQLGDGERRSLVDTWLTATFGFKERYSDQEIEAVCNAAGPEPYPSPGLASVCMARTSGKGIATGGDLWLQPS